jgi:hypothetical protein
MRILRAIPIFAFFPVVLGLFSGLSVGCAGDEGTGGAGGGGGGSGGGGACPAGQFQSADGPCRPVGVQACHETFIDSQGFCSPSVKHCPAGQIPNFIEGCVDVGIPDCAPEFVGDDGHCRVAMAKCSPGTFAVPQKGCVPFDGPEGCGSGTWGNIPDGPDNVYVDPNAPAGGDGSKASPVNTIAEALGRVNDGGRIALAAGQYTEHVPIDQSVEIAGRCASMVTIDGTNGHPSAPTVILAFGGSLSLNGVTLSGDGVGVLADGIPSLIIDRVVIDGCLGVGVAVFTTKAQITNTLIRGTRSQDGSYGRGLSVELGSEMLLRDSAVVDNREEGVWASGSGTLLTLSDVLVQGTQPEEATKLGGEGVKVAQRAEVELAAVAIVENRFAGIHVMEAGSSVRATDVVIERTLPQESNGHYGVGAQAWQSASLSIVRSALLENRLVGVIVDGAETTLTLDGTLIADMQGDQTEHFGRGVNLREGGTVTLTDSVFLRAREAAIVAIGTGTVLNATRVLVEDTQPDVAGEFGVGLIADASQFHLDSVVVSGGSVAGFLATQGTTATVSRCSITGVRGGAFHWVNPIKTFEDVGDGIIASDQSNVTISETRIAGCARAGLLFEDSTGVISLSSATENEFGLVLDGSANPTVDGTSSFDDNEQDRVDDAGLPVPTTPAAVPQ